MQYSHHVMTIVTIGLVSLPIWSVDNVVWPRPIGSRTHPAVPFGPMSPALLPRNLAVNANEAVQKPKSLKLLQQDAYLQQSTGIQLECSNAILNTPSWGCHIHIDFVKKEEYLRIMLTNSLFGIIGIRLQGF